MTRCLHFWIMFLIPCLLEKVVAIRRQTSSGGGHSWKTPNFLAEPFLHNLIESLVCLFAVCYEWEPSSDEWKIFTVWSNLWNPLTIWTLLSFTVWPRCNYISSGSLHYKTIDMSLASLKIMGSGLIIIQWDSISLPLSQDTIKWLKLAGIQFFS